MIYVGQAFKILVDAVEVTTEQIAQIVIERLYQESLR